MSFKVAKGITSAPYKPQFRLALKGNDSSVCGKAGTPKRVTGPDEAATRGNNTQRQCVTGPAEKATQGYGMKY